LIDWDSNFWMFNFKIAQNSTTYSSLNILQNSSFTFYIWLIFQKLSQNNTIFALMSNLRYLTWLYCKNLQNLLLRQFIISLWCLHLILQHIISGHHEHLINFDSYLLNFMEIGMNFEVENLVLQMCYKISIWKLSLLLHWKSAYHPM